MLSRLLLTAVLVIGLSASLQAQNNAYPRQLQRGRPAVVVQPREIQGVIEGVARGGIAVIDSNNQPWQVVVPPAAKVQVTGGATADYLQTGLIVAFKAEVDNRGAIKEKVGELTIVTLSSEKQMGLFPDAVNDQGEAGGDGGGSGGKPARRGKGPAAGAVPAGAYRIVGKLIVGRGGKLSVHTGRGVLPLELADQPTIAIDVADYTIAAKGDKISVKGVMMAGRAGLAQAHEVTIELVEPLVGVKKKVPPAKSEAKHPAKRPKKDEGLPEPAADK